MQNNVLFASFILRTCDVGNYDDGIINDARTQITWKNVDLRTIVGPMWDMYDYFSITLVTFMNVGLTKAPYTTQTGGYTHENSSAIIYLQGLPFVNCTYDYTKRGNSTSAPIGAFKFSYDDSASLTQNNQSNAVIFAKGQSMVDLTISLVRLLDAKLIKPIGIIGNIVLENGVEQILISTAIPDQCYVFRIDGIYNSHANAKM